MICFDPYYLVLRIVWTLFWWFVLGIIAAGICFARAQREPFDRWEEFPRHREATLVTDQIGAHFTILGGPWCFAYALWHYRLQYGWLWPWSKRAVREAHESFVYNKQRLSQGTQ